MKFDFTLPCDATFVGDTLSALCTAYPAAEQRSLGRSVFGRDIPILRMGNGSKKLLLVGGVHGAESITSALLLRFAADYLSAVAAGGSVYGLSMRYLFDRRTVYLIPMLNPDGIEIAIHGAQSAGSCEASVRALCPDGDFTHWQANGRGVDLNHNFDAGFEEYLSLQRSAGITAGPTRYSGESPESEPESAAVAQFLREEDIRLLAAFHTQGEELYCDSNGYIPPMGRAVGAALARMCGYRLTVPTGGAVYGGLKDYFIRAFNRPGYTIECGRGINPLPPSDLFPIYTRLRRALFHLPVLV